MRNSRTSVAGNGRSLSSTHILLSHWTHASTRRVWNAGRRAGKPSMAKNFFSVPAGQTAEMRRSKAFRCSSLFSCLEFNVFWPYCQGQTARKASRTRTYISSRTRTQSPMCRQSTSSPVFKKKDKQFVKCHAWRELTKTYTRTYGDVRRRKGFETLFSPKALTVHQTFATVVIEERWNGECWKVNLQPAYASQPHHRREWIHFLASGLGPQIRNFSPVSSSPKIATQAFL